MKRDQYGDRMFLGVYLWQWAVGLTFLVGFNLMTTVPLALSAYQQTHQTYSVCRGK